MSTESLEGAFERAEMLGASVDIDDYNTMTVTKLITVENKNLSSRRH